MRRQRPAGGRAPPAGPGGGSRAGWVMAGRPPQGIADGAGGVAGAHQGRGARADRCAEAKGLGAADGGVVAVGHWAELTVRAFVPQRRGDRSDAKQQPGSGT